MLKFSQKHASQPHLYHGVKTSELADLGAANQVGPALRRVLFELNAPLRRSLFVLSISFCHSVCKTSKKVSCSKSSVEKEKNRTPSSKDPPRMRAWTENPSLKTPGVWSRLSHLATRRKQRAQENTKIRTSAQRQPSSGGLAVEMVVLLFAQW